MYKLINFLIFVLWYNVTEAIWFISNFVEKEKRKTVKD